MPSSFTWLDYSEAERRKMLDVINLFKEKETRDELGVGSVRDAFADTFFPGTSTIQTRARYFLFIPWMYRYLEERRISSAAIAREARKFEIELIGGLLFGGEASAGVIGERARATLQRLPSSVYWQGLEAWGIRLFPGSQDQYHRSLERFYVASYTRRASRTTEDDPLDEPVSPNWHPRLPPLPANFPQKVTFALEPEEAEYLAERIKVSVPRSLLAHLIDMNCDVPRIAFIWEHPYLMQFPPHFCEQIDHARNFSEVIQGSALLYNLLLAELTQNEKLIDEYHAKLNQWAEHLETRQSNIQQWDIQRFWEIVYASGANVTVPTRRFIDAWIYFARTPGAPATVAEHSHVRVLVHERERQLKRRLARLDNVRAREQWSGAAGIGQLDYRWFRAQQLIADIQEAFHSR